MIATGWSNELSRGSALLMELEHKLASVNRGLLYIPGGPVFSLDDDHQRLSSRAIRKLTDLQQVNNPVKALGPINKLSALL